MHRAEQIMAAVVTALSGLTTTGANVERGRVYPLDANVSNALSVYQGAETVLTQSYQHVDAELRINIETHVRAPTVTLEGRLNQIRKEVTIALLSVHPPLNLAFCLDLREGDADQPELNGDGDRRTGSQRLEWIVTYRRSRTDPST
jgi:hypothetical protein